MNNVSDGWRVTQIFSVSFFILAVVSVFPSFGATVKGIVFVEMSGGEFLMGCPSNPPAPWKSPWRFTEPHRVSVSAFLMQKHPVTVSNFCDFMNSSRQQTNYYSFKELSRQVDRKQGKFVPRQGKESEPVGGIPYTGAKAFCEWFKPAGYECRLPTEAEWEFAARGKEGRTYPWGERRITDLPFGGRFTKPVGSRPDLATPDGIFELVGPVVQWCEDKFDSQFYLNSPIEDPLCRAGENRIQRGGASMRHGSLFNEKNDAPPAWRRYWGPDSEASVTTGFRMVLKPSAERPVK